MKIVKNFYFLFFSLLCLQLPAQEVTKIKADALFGSLRARQIGPALMSGRITDLQGHPTDAKVIYAGTAGGGVWVSQNGGVSYKSIFDEHCQSIGAIAVDPGDPDQTLWVGTGEIWTRNSTSVGDGIYLSKDGGISWKHKGLKETERISSVLIHPENSQEILVGALGALWGPSDERGIYKTEDGGESWEKIFSVDENTGCSELYRDPSNHDILYAAFWEFRRTAWSFSSGGEKSALYKSIDGGATWKKIHNGFPKGSMGRFAFAISPSNPNILYAAVESKDEKGKGLYRSANAGQSWEHVNKDFEITVRPFYFSRLVVHPSNPDMICKAGLFGGISEDGGKTFRNIGGGVHPDIHDFWFDINNDDALYIATDGGVYKSVDNGYSWEMAKDLPVSQFYHITTDNETPFNIYGGLQDNGSWIGPSSKSGGINSGDWQSVGYGDGFRVYPHPTDANIVYSEMQGADNVWRVDVSKNAAKVIKPYEEEGDPKLRFNWNAPLSTSMHEPDRLYIASQFVHVSDDRGESWRKMSGDLTTNDPSKQMQAESGGISMDNSGAENHCTIFTLAESPIDRNILWVGTDDGKIQLTSDNGQTWQDVGKNITSVPANTWVYHIEASSHDSKIAYAVLDGHTRNDWTPYVLKTTDGGSTWTSIATDEIYGFCRSIQEDYVNPNLLYLATEFGLYITLDGGLSWSQFTENVPEVAIHHITLHERDHSLVMGTHGRGVIIIDDVRPLRAITPDLLKEKLSFIETEPQIIHEPASFGGNSYPGEFVGPNPSRLAKIRYFMKGRHTFGKMKMEIFNDSGIKVAELNPGKSKGINTVEWNYRYKMPKIATAKNLSFGGFTTPTVPPGKYTVKITKGKDVFSSELELVSDPNSIHTDSERAQQHEVAMSLYTLNEDLAYTIEQINTIEKVAENGDYAQHKKLTSMLMELKSQGSRLKSEMVVLTGDNYVGQAEPKLREKIATLYSQVAAYPGKPTLAQIANYDKLQSEYNSVSAQWSDAMKILEKLNKLIEKKDLEPISIQFKSEYLGIEQGS